MPDVVVRESGEVGLGNAVILLVSFQVGHTGVPVRSTKREISSVQNTRFSQSVECAILGNGAQSLAGELHADVAAASAVKFRNPDAFFLQIGVYSAVHGFRDVSSDTTLLLSKTGAMDAAALVRDGEGDVADS